MHLKLRDQQLHICVCVCVCVCISLYTNVMVTPNPKSIIQTQKRERNPNNTKHRDQITKRTKEERNQKELQNTLKQLTKWQKHTHINNYFII